MAGGRSQLFFLGLSLLLLLQEFTDLLFVERDLLTFLPESIYLFLEVHDELVLAVYDCVLFVELPFLVSEVLHYIFLDFFIGISALLPQLVDEHLK